MVDREIFTYLQNQKQLILIVNKKFKNGAVDEWKELMEPFRVINRFNRLIVWNISFRADDPCTEKPVA